MIGAARGNGLRSAGWLRRIRTNNISISPHLSRHLFPGALLSVCQLHVRGGVDDTSHWPQRANAMLLACQHALSNQRERQNAIRLPGIHAVASDISWQMQPHRGWWRGCAGGHELDLMAAAGRGAERGCLFTATNICMLQAVKWSVEQLLPSFHKRSFFGRTSFTPRATSQTLFAAVVRCRLFEPTPGPPTW